MSKRILLVDDDPSVRMVFQGTLQEAGYTVEVATDGQEGLHKMQEGGFDVVLLDVMMPKIDGIGVLSELKDHPPKLANRQIILFTSLHDDPAVKEGLSIGATGFLIKSDLSPDVLVAKIREFADAS